MTLGTDQSAAAHFLMFENLLNISLFANVRIVFAWRNGI